MYKKARNLIVDLYRRDVRRRLTFMDVRQNVAGDAAALQRVFEFLEEWGLVNFQAPGGGGAADAGLAVAPDGACPALAKCPPSCACAALGFLHVGVDAAALPHAIATLEEYGLTSYHAPGGCG